MSTGIQQQPGSKDEENRKNHKPALTLLQAETLAASWLSVKPDSVEPLDSYDDQNFKVISSERTFCLKVHNGVESAQPDLIDAQCKLTGWLSEKGISCPHALKTIQGEDVLYKQLPVTNGEERMLAVRALHWVEGQTVYAAGCTAALLEKLGVYLGSVVVALHGFDHTALHREHSWDLRNTPSLRAFAGAIQDEADCKLVLNVVEEFERTVLPSVHQLRTTIIQGDFNDANVVVNADATEVAGVLDFGDAVHSWLINEVSIAMAYAMLSSFARDSEDPVGAAALLLRGYQTRCPLPPQESRHLRTLVASRLAMSIAIGAYSRQKDPGNAYLNAHAQPAIKALRTLWEDIPEVHTKALWEKAILGVSGEILLKVSRPPHPGRPKVKRLLEGTEEFAHTNGGQAAESDGHTAKVAKTDE